MAAKPETQDTERSGAPGAPTSRRGMLLGIGLAGLAGPVVAACGGSSDKSSGSSSGGDSGGSSGEALGKTSEIPVGGGKVFKDQKVVVTQPSQGEFKAFSAVCTHKGCTVSKVSKGTIDCPCHGSKFKIADGSVAHGPADKPLPSKNVTTSNGEIKLA